jgi:hypothetical protein
LKEPELFKENTRVGTEKITNVKIKSEGHADLLIYIKGIIHDECVVPKQSTKHSTFKFWNVYSSAFVKNIPNLWPEK